MCSNDDGWRKLWQNTTHTNILAIITTTITIQVRIHFPYYSNSVHSSSTAIDPDLRNILVDDEIVVTYTRIVTPMLALLPTTRTMTRITVDSVRIPTILLLLLLNNNNNNDAV